MKKGCIIYCIEKGQLEKYTLLSIATLLKFGGTISDWDIFCVQPRKEFPVSGSTKKQLERLGVNFINTPLNEKFRYYKLANKPLVCDYIFSRFDYDRYIFMDGDTLILNEPDELLDDNFDICLQKNYRSGIGVGNEDDPNYHYWKTLFNLLDSDLKCQEKYLPHLEEKEIFNYWNSAVISVKKQANVFSNWSEMVQKVLLVGLRPVESIYFVEESCLSAVVSAKNYNVKTPDIRYNFPLDRKIKGKDALYSVLKDFDNLVILHHLNELHWLIELNDELFPHSQKMVFVKQSMRSLNIHTSSLQNIYLNVRQGWLERYYYFKQKIANRN